jgi:hypothetical protein
VIWEVPLKRILLPAAIAAVALAGCQVRQGRDDVQAVAASISAGRVSKAAALGLPPWTTQSLRGTTSNPAARPVAAPVLSLAAMPAPSRAARRHRPRIELALFDPAFEMFLVCLNERVDWAAAAGTNPAQFWARDDLRQILSDCANENSVDLDALMRKITP